MGSDTTETGALNEIEVEVFEVQTVDILRVLSIMQSS